MRVEVKSPRGTGRSFKQLKAAPKKAVVIVPDLESAQHAVESMKRTDLILRDAAAVRFDAFLRCCAKHRIKHVIVDHALAPSARERNTAALYANWVKVEWGCDDT